MLHNVAYKNKKEVNMAAGVALRLSEELVNKAKQEANVYNRSITKQIEYWAKIGKIALDNPDLPVEFIIGILKAQEEVENEEFTEFKFDEDFNENK